MKKRALTLGRPFFIELTARKTVNRLLANLGSLLSSRLIGYWLFG